MFFFLHKFSMLQPVHVMFRVCEQSCLCDVAADVLNHVCISEPACQRNLDDLIDTLADAETVKKSETRSHDQRSLPLDPEVQKGDEEDEEEPDHPQMEEEVVDTGNESDSSMPSLEDSGDITVDDVTVVQKVPDDLTGGLRRRNRPE